jgi:hypothetical protein
LFFLRVKGGFSSALEVGHGLVETVNVLAEVMAMHKAPRVKVLDMGDILSLEVLVENHLKIRVIGVI